MGIGALAPDAIGVHALGDWLDFPYPALTYDPVSKFNVGAPIPQTGTLVDMQAAWAWESHAVIAWEDGDGIGI